MSTPVNPHPHLPAGRAPGSLTRRRGTAKKGVTIIGSIVGATFAFFFLFLPALVGLLILIAAAASDGASPLLWLGVVVAAAIVVAIPYGGYRLISRARRTVAEHLHIEISPAALTRGETVNARLQIAGPAGDRVEVGLVCTAWYDEITEHRHEGRTERRRTITQAEAYREWKPADTGSSLEQPFSFVVPADAPFSHEGEVVAFAWRVSAREPARLARDPSQDIPIWVAP